MAKERVQRRLAAILAADIVGYSRLMALDEAGTHKNLKILRAELFDPTTTSFGGRIFKNTGDGALAESSSAVDATLSAMAVQTDLALRNADVSEDQRITLRLGISVGDVIVDGDDLYGDGVNIAVRIEGLADPGGICLSEDVYRQVRGKVDAIFVDLGEQTVKNIIEPVQFTASNSGRAERPLTPLLRSKTFSSVPQSPFCRSSIKAVIRRRNISPTV